MKIYADTHTHTIMSGYAHSTLLENISEAKRKGHTFIALTDHTGLMPVLLTMFILHASGQLCRTLTME